MKSTKKKLMEVLSVVYLLVVMAKRQVCDGMGCIDTWEILDTCCRETKQTF